MPDIYFPISTTTLANSPTVNITIDNESTINLITLDERGFIGKTPLSAIKDLFGLNSIHGLKSIVTSSNVLLGRYSPGEGPIELIELGEGLSIENGVLSCNLEYSGIAGGDLEGEFPNPTLKNGVVTLSKFTGLSSNKLLGRFSPGEGSLEEISLSEDFEINNGVLSLITTTEISATGFIIENKSENFMALPTHMYFIEGNSSIIITVPTTGEIGDQFIIINKGLGNITINFPKETIIMSPAEQKLVGYFVRDDDDNFFALNL